jgi:hypothetical protein
MRNAWQEQGQEGIVEAVPPVERQLAVDGKTCRRSGGKGQSALHMG